MLMRRFPLLLVAAALAGCDVDGYTCPDVVLPAVVVGVADAATGDPLAEGSVAVARDGAFADTLRRYEVNDDLDVVSLAGAFGRAGVYEVTVERAGYEPWARSGVVVRSSGGECPQPETAVLEARLRRTSP